MPPNKIWCSSGAFGTKHIAFFGKNWLYLGTKDSLTDSISLVIGIAQETLLEQEYVQGETIAKKMAWASKRETTRLEDMAYCLLGIFDVHMPLLYGEGAGLSNGYRKR